MNRFVIATHSTFAQGIYECLKFFKNDIDNVHYINAYTENMEFEKEFVEVIEKYEDDNLIVLTDLPGGSVNIVCTNLMNKYNYKLVSGINFPLALEMIFYADSISDEVIEEIVNNARQQLTFINKDLIVSEDDDEEL